MTQPTRTVPRLHVLTDPAADDRALRAVDAALSGGAPAIQVRAKGLSDRDHLAFASAVVARCHDVGASCIVNDRVDIALASGADGVHLGADDLPIRAARALADTRLLIGGTARAPDTARQAVDAGADYLGCGPLYPTSTKDGLPDPIGLDTLAAIVQAVDVPIIGISGVTVDRVVEVVATGAHGVAVTAAVNAAADPADATRTLLARLPTDAPTDPTDAPTGPSEPTLPTPGR